MIVSYLFLNVGYRFIMLFDIIVFECLNHE